MTEDKRREEEEFSFVKEKIKHQPMRQHKWFRRVIFSMALSVLCGVIACFVFVKVYPWMEQKFGKEELEEITIPQEEEEPQEEIPVVEPQDPIVITETQELELEDYKKLYRKLRGVAAESRKSLVTVTVANSDTDWFNEIYESKNQVSGMLVGNNGVELLILTTYSEVASADSLQVTFVDDVTQNAVLKNYDRITDLAVISVNLADIPEETQKNIKTAELGSSRGMMPGEPIIAVGSPAGVIGSVLYGNLSVANYKTSVVDGEYTLMITDMARTADGSGVLVDLDGRVVGLLENKYLNSSNRSMLTAYGISDLKSVIEHLSNNKRKVYLGITGADVDAQISEAQGTPMGVYVTGVELDSPAMDAGIQAGDIVRIISGQVITSMTDIQDLLLKFSQEQTIEIVVVRQGREGYQEITCKVVLE